MKKRIVLVIISFCFSYHCYSQTVFYSEDFAGGLPAGWAIIDSVATPIGEVWQWSDTINPFAVTLVGGVSVDSFSTLGTTAANGYMIFDSDGYGDNSSAENSSLVSTPINCSGAALVHLSFHHYYRDFTNSVATVLVSTDSINWWSVMDFDSTTPNADSVDIDISSIAANADSVYLRFRYTGNWGWYWMLDDIKLYVPSGVGTNEINTTDHFFVFPNPSSGMVTIYKTCDEKPISIHIFNCRR